MESENSEKKNLLKNRIWLIFPILHWGMSFFYERLILKWDANSWDIFWSESLDDRFSNSFQSIVLYICGKIVAGVLIFLLWYGLRNIVTKHIPMHITVIFLIICMVVGTFLVFCWPWSFDWEDAFTLYGFAVRMIPWYWHHYLTSALFVGCLMVIPVPFAISVIQFIFFAAIVARIYYRLEKVTKTHFAFRLMIFLIYLAPSTYSLLAQGYRNCFYTMLCMYYIEELCFDAIVQRKKESVEKTDELSTKIKLAILVVVAAILSVWRTEGILIGFVGTLIAVFLVYKISKRTKIIGVLGFFAVFFMLSLPQKIGDIKYYNKDYLIMSTIESLQAELNDRNINLSYSGAQDDLAAIDNYVPMDYIKQYGAIGKRSWLYNQGHEDFDQSCASDEVQSAYIKAYIRLTLHNIKPFVKKQMNSVMAAYGIGQELYLDPYIGPDTNGASVQYDKHRVGRNDVFYHPIVQKWMESKAYNTIGMQIHEINCRWVFGIRDIAPVSLLRIIIIVANLMIMVVEFIRLLMKKRERMMYGVLAFLLSVQHVIICMTVPAGYKPYFFSIWYPSIVLILIYLFDVFGEFNDRRKQKK